MRGLIFILGSISLTAQQGAIDEAIAKVIPISGLWEAPVNPKDFNWALPVEVKGLVFNLETQIEKKEATIATTIKAVRIRPDVTESYGHIWNFYLENQVDLHHLDLTNREYDFRITATIDRDKQIIRGTFIRSGKSIPLAFTRLSRRGSPLDGVWKVSSAQPLSTVGLQIVHSLAGRPFLSYFYRDKGDGRFVRLGEYWRSYERNQEFHAETDRPAFGAGHFIAKTSADGGVLQTNGNSFIGFMTPATFTRSEFKDLLLQ